MIEIERCLFFHCTISGLSGLSTAEVELQLWKRPGRSRVSKDDVLFLFFYYTERLEKLNANDFFSFLSFFVPVSGNNVAEFFYSPIQPRMLIFLQE